MTENYFFKDGLRTSQKHRNLLLNLGALMVDLNHLFMIISSFQNLFKRLEFAAFVGYCQEVTADGHHWSFIEGSEFKSCLGLNFGLTHNAGVHEEIFAFVAGGRKGTSGYVFEEFDYGLDRWRGTVFPEPFLPQIKVRGFWNYIFCMV